MKRKATTSVPKARTLKNRVLLEDYFLPGDLERQIEAFIEHYNHWRTLHSPGHG
jgi:putative transposase